MKLELQIMIFLLFSLLVGCIDSNTGGGVVLGGLLVWLIFK